MSDNTDAGVYGEEQDYLFWFFRVSADFPTSGTNGEGMGGWGRYTTLG